MIGETSIQQIRYDRFTPEVHDSAFERLDNGGIRTVARVARLGIYEYRNSDGSVRRELVDDMTLSDPQWLASCKGAPITNDHPSEPVTTVNMRQHRIGVALSEGEFQKPYHVQRDFQVDEASGLDALDFGRVEVSPGYTCDTIGPDGVHPDFGAYDVIQRNRRCNHIAICDNARGGTSCRVLHVDSNSGVVGTIENVRNDSESVAAVPAPVEESPAMTLSPIMKDVLALHSINCDGVMSDEDAKGLIAKKLEEEKGAEPAVESVAAKEEVTAKDEMPKEDVAKMDEYSAEASAKIAELEAKVQELGAAKTAAEVALQKALEEHEMHAAEDAMKCMDEMMDDPDGSQMDVAKMDSVKADSIKASRRRFFDAFNARADARMTAVRRAVEAGIPREDAVKLGRFDLVKRTAKARFPNAPDNLNADGYEALISVLETHSKPARRDSNDFWESLSLKLDASQGVEPAKTATYIATPF